MGLPNDSKIRTNIIFVKERATYYWSLCLSSEVPHWQMHQTLLFHAYRFSGPSEKGGGPGDQKRTASWTSPVKNTKRRDLNSKTELQWSSLEVANKRIMSSSCWRWDQLVEMSLTKIPFILLARWGLSYKSPNPQPPQHERCSSSAPLENSGFVQWAPFTVRVGNYPGDI